MGGYDDITYTVTLTIPAGRPAPTITDLTRALYRGLVVLDSEDTIHITPAAAPADWDSNEVEIGGYEAEMLDEWRELFPPADGWTVEIIGTGGGCDWLTVSHRNDPAYYYAATDGDGNIPEPGDGWRYVGRYARDDRHPDWQGHDLTGQPDWPHNTYHGQHDDCPITTLHTHPAAEFDAAQAAEIIRADLYNRAPKGEN